MCSAMNLVKNKSLIKTDQSQLEGGAVTMICVQFASFEQLVQKFNIHSSSDI